MKRHFSSTVLFGLLATTVAAPAAAQTWDATSGFNTPSWSYMQRTGPGCSSAATPLAFPYTGPSGTNFIGKQGVNTPVIVPLVGKNLATSGVTVYSTAQIPANAVWMHPGETGANASCAVIRFTAPTAGTYRVKGFLKSVDTGANSVNGYIFSSGGTTSGAIALTGPMGTSVAFDKLVTITGPNKWVDFALDDGGSYYNDSTQISLKVTRCPGGVRDPKGCKGDQGDGDATGGGVGTGGNGDGGAAGGGIPVLSCSQSQNNPASVNLSTGQPGWSLILPNNTASAIAPTPAMVPSPWTAVPGAQWVGPQGAPQTAGAYIYETKVRILKCPNGRPAKLTAQFRADNVGTLTLLDPASATLTTMAQAGTPNYGFLPASLSPAGAPGTFTWSAPVNGVYTIRLRVQNAGGPTGVAANIIVSR